MFVARIKDARLGAVAGTADVRVEFYDDRANPDKLVKTKLYSGVTGFANLVTLVTTDLAQLQSDDAAVRLASAFPVGKEVARV
jgi:hypothetical protein